MSAEIDLKNLDRRTVERYIARGVISAKDYERHLKSLADAAANAAPVSSVQPDVEHASRH